MGIGPRRMLSLTPAGPCSLLAPISPPPPFPKDSPVWGTLPLPLCTCLIPTGSSDSACCPLGGCCTESTAVPGLSILAESRYLARHWVFHPPTMPRSSSVRFTLWTRKLRLREVKGCAHGYLVGAQQAWGMGTHSASHMTVPFMLGPVPSSGVQL